MISLSGKNWKIDNIRVFDRVSACCQLDILDNDIEDICDYIECIGIDLINIAYEMKKDIRKIE
mgnify:CR=1 FL=1